VIIFPAIDIRDGKCVRLIEGDFDRETVFNEDPVDAARVWESMGATHIHLVDLDGAKVGSPQNIAAISAIRDAVGVFLQVGGGIRTVKDADLLLGIGIDRIILGSVLVKDPRVTKDLAQQFPGKIAAGLDARDGLLATDGWLEQSTALATDVAREMIASGVADIIYTDIRRDGTLAGPNLNALNEMIAIEGARIIASGGIGSAGDVENVARAGSTGVIIGRALYDGRVNLAEVLSWQ
jgi:phosphoribosylformimino-5-aminoimidazole carboxamide ribotide isomerase